MASLGTVSKEGNEVIENDSAATDATRATKMAVSAPSHGQKRRLSLSPLQTLNSVKISTDDHKTVGNIQTSKKRFLSVNFDDLIEIDQDTGNDPVKSHSQPGSDTPTEQCRSKSNMAAPTKVNNRSPNITKRDQQTTPMASPETHLDSILIPNAVERPAFSRHVDQPPSNCNYVNFRGVQSTRTIETSVSTDSTVSTITTPSSLPNPTSTNETLNSVIRSDEISCPYEETTTKGHNTSAVKIKALSSPPCPDARDVEPPSPHRPCAEVVESSGPHYDGDDIESVSENETPTDKEPKRAVPRRNDPFNARLRSKGSRPSKPPAPDTSCKTCPACIPPTDTEMKKKSIPKPKPKPNPKPSRGRGRPRKLPPPSPSPSPIFSSPSSSDQIPKDFRRLLLDIKGEVALVNEKQESCSEDLCTLMDVKMNDFKHSLGNELNNVKDNIKNNTALLSDLQESQTSLKTKLEIFDNLKTDVSKISIGLSNLESIQTVVDKKMANVDERVISLEDRACDIEVNLIKQRKEVDKSNQLTSQQISDLEFGLAAHIETVKNNVERELVGAKQSHISIENKLTNFTIDLQNQNRELNNKMNDLRGDFEQLKTLSDRVEDTTSPNSNSNLFSNKSDNSCWGKGSLSESFLRQVR